MDAPDAAAGWETLRDPWGVVPRAAHGRSGPSAADEIDESGVQRSSRVRSAERRGHCMRLLVREFLAAVL